jgi:hypothetical protein
VVESVDEGMVGLSGLSGMGLSIVAAGVAAGEGMAVYTA